nr:MAG: hypothetical protein [Reoviridae sp.]
MSKLSSKDRFSKSSNDNSASENVPTLDDKVDKLALNESREGKVKTDDRLALVSDNDSQRGELAEVGAVGDQLMSNMDMHSAVLQAAVKHVLRQQELQDRAQRVSLESSPINDWSDMGIISSLPTRKIVNQIPHVLKLTRSQNNILSRDVLMRLAGQYASQLDTVMDSCEMFSSGTDEVTYSIETYQTGVDISYNPESPPLSTLKLKSFLVSGGDDNTSMENGESRTDAFSGLLELILKLRKCGDVYVQGPDMVAVADIGITNEPISLFSGRNVPTGMLPNILVGTYCHTLPWFVKKVRELVPIEDVLLGEYDGVVKAALSEHKARSNYAVFTDSIFATLNHIHMEKHDRTKCNAGQFAQAVRSLAPNGSTVLGVGDTEVDMWETFQPDRQDADKYVFAFLLSPVVRRDQYKYLETFIADMRGIKEVTASDRIRMESVTIDPMNTASVVQDALLRNIRGYHMQHFIQMMVMERAHAFIEPIANIESGFSSMQDAVVALLSVALDALMFPNLFWTNLQVYALPIYNAWKLLNAAEYQAMINLGFTEHNPRPKHLTKQELRDGEIPRIFSNLGNRLPRFITRYIACLRPVGVLYDLPVGQQQWCPIVNTQPSFYIPFQFLRRPKIGYVPDNPISDQIIALTALLKEMLNVWKRTNAQNGNVTSSVGSILSTLSEMGRTFGSICHYELNIIYRSMANGPEIIYTTYTGAAAANISPYVGLTSTVSHPQYGLASIDRTDRLHTGIGLWALMSLMGDQLSVSGIVTDSIPSSFMFADPRHRLLRFYKLIEQVSPVADAFGIMSYLQDSEEEPEGPWKFLVNIFGASLKAGVASQILDWLLPGMSIKEFVFGKAASTDAALYADTRLRKPRFTEMGSFGAVLPPREGVSEYLKRPLDLLDNYELRKLQVAVSVVASENSCLHNYNQTIVIARTSFQYFSPLNRHPDAAIEIDFTVDQDAFGTMLYGNELMTYFTVLGNRWFAMWQPNFPERVRVRIFNPAEVLPHQWDFMEEAMETKGWQIELNGVNFLTKVIRMSQDIAQSYAKGTTWHYLKQARYGTIAPVTFIDTRFDIVNNRLTVFPSGCTQYICAVSPVQRNVAVRSIIGMSPTAAWIPPDPDMWTIGQKNSEDIPRDTNGTPKYALNVPNFNNFLTIWTKTAQLLEAPPTCFFPPIGESL